ncbi:MAG: hypothetical protein NTW87_30445 [Planctomycetota bacterium]|nr:hypothetical protein [Planctomycetota bacterium]
MKTVNPTLLWMGALCLSCSAAARAEEPKPPAPQPPKVVSANPMGVTDWTPHLRDFQSADAARQQAATQVFLDAGARGHAVLNAFLKNASPDVVKRATEARQEIDARSWKMYQDVAAEHGKLRKQPLTAAALENMRQAYMRMGMYASPVQLKQLSFQTAAELQKTIKAVEEAGTELAALDVQLQAAPEPKGLARAGIQLQRASALKTLQRDADMLAAARDAVAASGRDGRHTPGALKLEAEACSRVEDAKGLEAACRRLLTEYPRSLEVKFAQRTLIDLLSASQKWDEAMQQAKAFLAAFPVDEEAQDAAYSLLDTLRNDERDFVRLAAMAEWLMGALPLDRLKPEVPKYSGGCNEYIFRDCAKAARAYTMLRDGFTDLVSVEDMNAALARLKAKTEGKFPKEPLETDPGAAGAFARFLKAIRTRDAKALAAVAAKDEADDLVERLGDSSDDLLPTILFADFVLKQVQENEAKDAAKLTLDYYEASASKPKTVTQEAVKEGAQWKIKWQDLEEDDADAAPAKK